MQYMQVVDLIDDKSVWFRMMVWFQADDNILLIKW